MKEKRVIDKKIARLEEENRKLKFLLGYVGGYESLMQVIFGERKKIVIDYFVG